MRVTLILVAGDLFLFFPFFVFLLMSRVKILRTSSSGGFRNFTTSPGP